MECNYLGIFVTGLEKVLIFLQKVVILRLCFNFGCLIELSGACRCLPFFFWFMKLGF